MTRKELIERIVAKTHMSSGVAENFLEVICVIIQEGLLSKESILLPGLGKLDTKVRAARQGRNPKTGETIHIPSKTVADFKPSTRLKQLLKNVTNC